METKRPRVFLQGNPGVHALEKIWHAKMVQSRNVPHEYNEITAQISRTELEEMFRTLIKDKLSPFFRWVTLDWTLEGVSRALQQQLTRHKLGFEYSIQSLRVVAVEDFAAKGMYHVPATVKDKEDFHKSMLAIEDRYNRMINIGESVQDARGILPLNIHSTVSFTCNLQAFIDMMNKRFCLKTQGEFQHVALLMLEEFKRKMPAVMAEAFGEPCRFGPCIMIPENEQQAREKKFTGKANTDHVCPLYIELGGYKSAPVDVRENVVDYVIETTKTVLNKTR
jgi:flavin-dependent thymidylate synthase